jgi:hypothetical protein
MPTLLCPQPEGHSTVYRRRRSMTLHSCGSTDLLPIITVFGQLVSHHHAHDKARAVKAHCFRSQVFVNISSVLRSRKRRGDAVDLVIVNEVYYVRKQGTPCVEWKARQAFMQPDLLDVQGCRNGVFR